jgi:hypothetical protein
VYKVIDNCDSSTGWTSSDITKISLTENQVTDFIANELTKSIIIHSSQATNAYIQKTFTAIDVSLYSEIIISVASLRFGDTGLDYNHLSDFQYSIGEGGRGGEEGDESE